jgi:hypothetical protein
MQRCAYNAASERKGSILNVETLDDPLLQVLVLRTDIKDRECFTTTVALDRITHVSCEDLHPPVSGVATSKPRPCHRLRAFHAGYPVRVPI